MSVDLTTRYLGLNLKNPLVAAACPLVEDIDNLRRLEAAGIAAAVLPSVFEEQIVHEEEQLIKAQEAGTDSFAEALTYFPPMENYHIGPDAYLRHIEKSKKAVSIPIIGSLNGSSHGGWIRYARLIEEAGADALELNVYFIAAEVAESGASVEDRYVELVAAVKQSIGIPLAVKIGPYFSSTAHMAKRLVEAGADGLVLFNRFLQPDIDLETLEIAPRMVLSSPHELLVPLRWIAILHGRVSASLAATSGIHSFRGLVKALLAGADVGMVASMLYSEGAAGVHSLLQDLRGWLEEKEYRSVAQLKGSLSQKNCPDPAAFERGNYMKVLASYAGKLI